MDGNAGGVAKALVAKGSLGVWQYAVRKAATGDLEQAPLRKIGLIAGGVAARRALCDAAEGAADRGREVDGNRQVPAPSLRANGSRECAPDDRLREAIQLPSRRQESWIASPLRSSQ